MLDILLNKKYETLIFTVFILFYVEEIEKDKVILHT